ncbi:glutathione peroxidase [Heliorestis acidaminivorans]|uniref:Glutathione peroxidase n=1 Tax=Heliorestis acidaminivorans TaxID=553427 RepID=A0A6I0EVD7_9FIRM|nr:glutathione peroxidase [Heliorestis acidaminivorans]KAB2953444.1 glutathione peroxidase [Heliorestis acidaminivorans]
MSIYDFTVNKITGEEESLAEYKGKVILIVNTASNCGFTPQYKGLQRLYELYKDQGFVILGFPSNQFMNQEPASNDEIMSFCELNFGVTFPLYAKIDVNGPEAHPLYQYLTQNKPGLLGSTAIKWNFTKFLIDRNGKIVERFAPTVTPEQIEAKIQALL